MDNLQYSIIFMLAGSFIVQYFLMSSVVTNSLENINNSLGKFYMSVIMGLLMVIIEFIMHTFHGQTIGVNLYIFVVMLTIFFIIMYRYQIWIDEKEYLKEMIEHHSMAILTSGQIIQNTKNEKVINLANRIIAAQNKEIDEMKSMLK